MNITDRVKSLYAARTAQTSVISGSKQPPLVPVYRRTDPARIAWIEGGVCCMEFPKDKDVIGIIKRISERQYIEGDNNQYWEAPASLDCLDKLVEAGFTFDPSVDEWKSDLFKPVVYDPDFTVPDMLHWDYLEEFQKKTAQFIEAKKGRVLLADDPGLGKTMGVISWLQLRQDVNPVLIICPANAKYTWHDELNFWTHEPYVQIVSGLSETNIKADFVIINYDILTRLEQNKNVLRSDIWKVKWQAVIIDEGHYISNTDTIRGWAVSQLTERTPHVIIVTATPGDKNKHKFTLCNLLDKRIFPSFFKFAHRFCDPKINKYTNKFEFNGSSNEEELHQLLASTIMLRRTKQDVFKDFPRIFRRVIALPLDNFEEYQKEDTNFHNWLFANKNGNKALSFSKVEKLSQMAVQGKFDAAVEWINNLLLSSNKIIIFCEHQETVLKLHKIFKKISVVVDGKSTDKQKEHAKQAFQQCKICGIRKEKHDYDENACKKYEYDMNTRIFIGSRAAKESITLTAAYDVVFLELWWSNSDMFQAEGRCYGRKGDLHGATSWYLVGHGTIEALKIKILDIKNKRNEKIMNGKELNNDELLVELLKECSKDHIQAEV